MSDRLNRCEASDFTRAEEFCVPSRSRVFRGQRGEWTGSIGVTADVTVGVAASIEMLKI